MHLWLSAALQQLRRKKNAESPHGNATQAFQAQMSPKPPSRAWVPAEQMLGLLWCLLEGGWVASHQGCNLQLQHSAWTKLQ